MAHLWIQDETHDWCILELTADGIDLTQFPPLRFDGSDCGDTGVLLTSTRTTDPQRATWTLMWKPETDVRVNGIPSEMGIRVLTDRDEIQLDGRAPMFFSTQSPARIERFAGSERDLDCPRCKLPIVSGEPVVRCPDCSVVYHEIQHELQEKHRNCWTYTENCAVCSMETALDGSYRWTPEEL